MPRTSAAKKRARKAKSAKKGDVAASVKGGPVSDFTDSNQAGGTGAGAAPEDEDSSLVPLVSSPITRGKKGVASKAVKRKRSASSSPVPDFFQAPMSPDFPAKQTEAGKRRKKQTTPKNGTHDADSGAETEKKDFGDETDANDGKERATVTKAAKAPKAGPRKWRKDWKEWISAPENQSTDQFDRNYDEDLINVKESAKVYGIKSEDLACLPHCPVQNPHGKGFTPMKFFLKTDVIQLAFRKEAVLAGVSQDDEEELLVHGEELYEEKNGPVDELYDLKMEGLEPAMNRY
ncbi:uncharacterized protein N0V89_004762 [Didymosphaeria variabile]|uniref:Uncharacterized protein n=1 Tax=Didymosphaeria variabile TaxID=1932322 RepID=A0A9W9CDW0_9PLEO|nr:uncharacterized protein N0V89_004762 [Didymosphaeria variabile]KAJ4356726.1 hypothetical protein N0V89_004762 [Didymosphaeria variabile]